MRMEKRMAGMKGVHENRNGMAGMKEVHENRNFVGSNTN